MLNKCSFLTFHMACVWSFVSECLALIAVTSVSFLFFLSAKKTNGIGSYGGGGVTETDGGRRGDSNRGLEEG